MERSGAAVLASFVARSLFVSGGGAQSAEGRGGDAPHRGYHHQRDFREDRGNLLKNLKEGAPGN